MVFSRVKFTFTFTLLDLVLCSVILLYCHFFQKPKIRHSSSFLKKYAATYSNILIYSQQDATLHRLFYLETTLHFSGGTTTHHQKRKQMYLQHLVFVTPLLLPAAIATNSTAITTLQR
jgi:hypothetical protein